MGDRTVGNNFRTREECNSPKETSRTTTAATGAAGAANPMSAAAERSEELFDQTRQHSWELISTWVGSSEMATGGGNLRKEFWRIIVS